MITVRLRRGPYGIPVAEVEAPCEFLGEFLTVEGGSLDSWACEDLLSVAQEIRNGDTKEFHRAGDAHTVTVTTSGVLIQSEYREPPAQCELSLEGFVTAIQKWKALLKQHSRRK